MKKVLELENKVVVIRLNHQSHGTHGTTIEATQHIVEPSTSKDISFKKKDILKQKMYRCLKSLVVELEQKKKKSKTFTTSIKSTFIRVINFSPIGIIFSSFFVSTISNELH